ncbi:hypothetical protein ASPFODRAFT_208623 [Aspergillus luchuensis CBS 106.47]|uniref:Uncharacterized protein n=1 Tax=Aspergillus luchuensis (strain CBS 106.47) TaxID=1137211 RepID=A0A1M3TFE7_ASPLC|nr:hypothetical protein ASPFODRAFT_208623 [Aspergillus luchuensis CBS 106.47]
MRRAHYVRAKASYDADSEKDSTVLAAALLLLRFWWTGPEIQTNSCYWHIPVRDVPAKANLVVDSSFEQPCRFRDEDCDVDPPSEDDFSFNRGY